MTKLVAARRLLDLDGKTLRSSWKFRFLGELGPENSS
jgi:hypothetical protein